MVGMDLGWHEGFILGVVMQNGRRYNISRGLQCKVVEAPQTASKPDGKAIRLIDPGRCTLFQSIDHV